MDIALEFMDTVLLDRVYSTILPVAQRSLESASGNDKIYNDAVVSDLNQHLSRYFELQPTKWATMSQLPRGNILRQGTSLFLIIWIFGLFIYFLSSTLSYFLVFDKTAMTHPKFLRNQIRMEISQAALALPVMSIFTVPFFLAEVRGYAKLYDGLDEAPFTWYNYLQFPFFIGFTDFCIYWIHRGLHHPLIYKWLHKPHHKWIVPTPFASYAFHPLDGFSQSVPYHLFPFIFPLQKFAYLGLFAFVTLWTVFIHDGEYAMNSPIINGAACHTYHHLYFNYNYGQFTTLWDRLGGSYRRPDDELFNRDTKMGKKEWDRQVQEMERLVKEVEGVDDRSYSQDTKKVQ